MSDVRILHGDCIDVLRTLPDNSIDSLVCDPPAGIAFMGRSWDSDKGGRDEWIEWLASVMREALRVLKPGAHGLVWALPRTSHWTGMALERAGFEVRDRIVHHFGNGFPKSMDVSKAIDAAAGAERTEIVGVKPGHESFAGRDTHPLNDGWSRPWASDPEAVARYHAQMAPATDAAKQWSGWGTALKPATEDWWLVRKPLTGTVAANVQEHGTGALNIDGCRIRASEALVRPSIARDDNEVYGAGLGAGAQVEPIGRWPANVAFSHAPECVCVGKRTVRGDRRPPQDGAREGGFADVGAPAGDGKPCGPLYGDETVDVFACVPWCPVRELDAQSGERKAGGNLTGNQAPPNRVAFGADDRALVWDGYGDTGGASRFFYCAKPSTAEREAGLDGMERKTAGELTGGRKEGSAALDCPRTGAGRTGGRANIHPTVKSIDLMRWLIRLITPPGGTVLDCFMGSGSTGCAAVLERMSFIGIEREDEYAEIARRRIAYWGAHRPADQLSLLDVLAVAPEPQKGAA